MGAVYAAKCTGAASAAYYDQMKFDITTAAGNIHVGVYDDSANPNNLLADSGALTAIANYTTIYPIPEFQALSTTLWFASEASSGSLIWHIWTSGYVGKFLDPHSYGALPNPYGTPTGSANSTKMKLNHS